MTPPGAPPTRRLESWKVRRLEKAAMQTKAASARYTAKGSWQIEPLADLPANLALYFLGPNLPFSVF